MISTGLYRRQCRYYQHAGSVVVKFCISTIYVCLSVGRSLGLNDFSPRSKTAGLISTAMHHSMHKTFGKTLGPVIGRSVPRGFCHQRNDNPSYFWTRQTVRASGLKLSVGLCALLQSMSFCGRHFGGIARLRATEGLRGFVLFCLSRPNLYRAARPVTCNRAVPHGPPPLSAGPAGKIASTQHYTLCNARNNAKTRGSESESESESLESWQRARSRSRSRSGTRSRTWSRNSTTTTPKPWQGFIVEVGVGVAQSRGNESEVGVGVRVGQKPGIRVGLGVGMSPQRLKKPDQSIVNRVAKVRAFCPYFCPNFSHSLFGKTLFFKFFKKHIVEN